MILDIVNNLLLHVEQKQKVNDQIKHVTCSISTGLSLRQFWIIFASVLDYLCVSFGLSLRQFWIIFASVLIETQ
jgi:hypothetical protein